MEIFSPPKMIVEVKLEKINPSTEGGVRDMINFNDEDLLLPELGCSSEAGVLLSDVELHKCHAHTHTLAY